MRRARGMTQASVAEVLNCDHSAVSRIESGQYPLTPQMFRPVERLLSFAAADGYETWFISYLEIERTATVLRTWEPLVIPDCSRPRRTPGRCLRAPIRAGATPTSSTA
jgi:transcriptional regulator with XRE-family HTH domain